MSNSTGMPSDAELYPYATIVLRRGSYVTQFEGVSMENHVLCRGERGDVIPYTYLGSVSEIRVLNNEINAMRSQHFGAGFLFYANPWSGNFQHLLTELFPKVIDYIAVQEATPEPVPLLIPKPLYNSFVHELLMLSKAGSNIVLLEKESVYSVERLYSSSYIPNFHGVSPKLLSAFQHLRRCFLNQYGRVENCSAAKPRHVYLARDKAGDPAFNNNNAGSKRVILNEEQVIAFLTSKGFHTVALGARNIKEKAELLQDSRIIISPIGANLLNLLFLSPPYPERVGILYSTSFRMFGYFVEIFEALYDKGIVFETLAGEAQSGEVNSPYGIDISGLEGLLDRL